MVCDMSLTYSIQGFDLHQPEIGFKLLVGSSFAPAVSPRRVDLEIPLMHGQVPLWDDPLPAQKLTLKVRIEDSQPDMLRQKWEHLRALMWTGANRGLTIRRVMAGQVTSAFGQLETMSEPDFWLARGMVDVVMVFNIPYGRWESIQTQEVDLPLNGQEVQIPFVAESTGPITNMLFQVKGPTATEWSLTVRDETSRTGFVLARYEHIPTDDYWVVDPENYRAWDNQTDSDWNARHEDRSTYLRPLGVSMLQLVSVPSFQVGNRSTNITISSTGFTSGSYLKVRGRATYI